MVTAYVSVDGKLIGSTPKSHRHREVPLSRFLAEQLGTHVARRGRKDLVFSTASGAPRRSSNLRQRY